MQTNDKTKGKYWDKAWGLVNGCTPVSPACDNCWLASMDYRFHANYRFHAKLPVTKVTDTGRISFTGLVKERPDRLDLPLETRKPTTFAIWSDLFHEKVPFVFVDMVFEMINLCCNHTFLICTKRPERMAEYFNREENYRFLAETHKIFLGTTVENQEMADKRIPKLLKCKPFKLFLSVEPMLERIAILQEQLQQISYVIAGCESGHHKRETKEEWFRDLREQCIEAGVPFFLKQPLELQHLSTIKREDLWK